MQNKSQEQAKKEILSLVKQYYQDYMQPKAYQAGEKISYAGRVFDEDEMVNLVDSSLDFWLTSGRYADQFERDLASFLKVRHCLLTNSGSSANLLAFWTLTSPKLGEKRICRGDEVITVAAGFPTTVAPIVQYGAIPVFVDVTLPEYNIDVTQLEEAYSQKTKAVMIAHTLGNPFDLKAVKSFCEKYDLWLIEDNCDALGSQYEIDGEWKYTGTIGDIGTSSFYPPHHMTMGEGGAVYTNNRKLYQIIKSFRDWGRDCWCPSGKDNTCQCRFTQQFGSLPVGYDHKYVYAHFGFNLKVTDMQAAIGCAQLEKLPHFTALRKRNWQLLKDGLRDLQDVLLLPEKDLCTDPSWFGFLITVKENCPVTRDDLVHFLEENGIQTRMLFAGNLLRHPCMEVLTAKEYRVVGSLENTERIMKDTFWIGVYPGMTEKMIGCMVSKIREGVLKS